MTNLLITLAVTIHEPYVAWHVCGHITRGSHIFKQYLKWWLSFYSVVKLSLAAVPCILTKGRDGWTAWNSKLILRWSEIKRETYIILCISQLRFLRYCVSRWWNRKISFCSTVNFRSFQPFSYWNFDSSSEHFPLLIFWEESSTQYFS